MSVTIDRWAEVKPDEVGAIKVSAEQYRNLMYGGTVFIGGKVLGMDDGPFIISVDNEKDKVIKQAEIDTRLRTASSRLPMWINRYTEVVNTAKTMACANQKLMWTLGPTEHCSSCLKLADKVKRGKFWQESGVLPQSRELECGGFRCQCSLQPTDAPVSRGPLPRLP